MMEKAINRLRRAALYVIGNECLFMFASLVVWGVLTMGPLLWHQEKVMAFDSYVLIPWGCVLCVRLLESRPFRSGRRYDVAVLAVLALWVIVPFALRFGLTKNNMSSWHGFAAAYFGIYVSVSLRTAQEREHMLDLAAALFAALSFVLGAAALGCVAGVKLYGAYEGVFGFGVGADGILRIGQHHNSTGMLAMLCTLMCLIGVCRRRTLLMKAAHLIPAVMMAVVTVLSQSRTSRYALLAALALGAYGYVACRGRLCSRLRCAAARHAAGVLAGVLVFAAGYMAASAGTDAAMAHYERAAAGQHVSAQPFGLLAATAAAEAEEPAQQEENVTGYAARGAGDATFTGRTLIWKNLFRLWRENPRHFVIGQGVGRTGSRIVEGTLLEEGGSATAHNTYLQFAADFGLIGFALIAAFLGLLVAPCLRVFYAGARSGRMEDVVLCMIAAACLIIGMMESDPLASMRFCNVVLLFAFAQIMGRSLDVQSLVQKS
ncbi:MAG: O-antigen ligase family protein [Clostridia bacterium]|nr:O-antigen ligase family protein [Clostridia bacterium]